MIPGVFKMAYVRPPGFLSAAEHLSDLEVVCVCVCQSVHLSVGVCVRANVCLSVCVYVYV